MYITINAYIYYIYNTYEKEIYVIDASSITLSDEDEMIQRVKNFASDDPGSL